jgi:hypothetical protein
MSGTYLICDLCGNPGPPAMFIMKDGIRLCYVCHEQGETEQNESSKPHEKTRKTKPQA